MAVVPMKRMTIIAARSDRKAILEYLQRQGEVEIDRESPDDPYYHKIDVSGSRQIFEKNVGLIDQALSVLDTYAPLKTGLLDSMSGRTILSLEDYEKGVAKRDKVMDITHQILSLQKEDAECKASVPKYEISKESLASWMNFDLPLDFKGTKRTKAFIGTLPGEWTMENIYLELGQLSENSDRFDVNLINAETQQTCVMIVCGADDEAELSDALHRMNFAKAPISHAVPSEEAKELDAKIARANAQSANIAAKIMELSAHREDLKFIRDYFKMRADKYEVIGEINQSDRVFILSGYIAAESADSLAEKLNSKYDIVLEFEDPSEDEEVPVKLKNRGYGWPIEGLVENYSMPGKGEIDPSFVTSLFYYICFGLMLSDAAYGLIIALATGVCLYKFKNMEMGLRRNLKMFFFCGIWTVVAGFVFGSFFGDSVSSIAQTFFGVEKAKAGTLLPALWFNPLDNPIKMLTFSFGFGLIHLFTGLGVLIYTDVKNGKVADAIYDGVFWMMFVGGCVGFLLTVPMITNMLGVTALGGNVATVSKWVAIIGVLGVVAFGGRDSASIGGRIGSGLYSAYGITSYLSDVLSYSRLLALGLATSVISSVFNTMAGMVGGALPVFFGVILYAIIFIIGHVLNLAINALGAYVHANRLQYVEFFGKFYHGGGRLFTPFAAKTKFFRIKEDK
ncbi:MAG: V-type ATP synthase subunit I [Lachnospiraceae bacterium]|nr:V-type ATP synthase subunit I [Lachnospiraceae bacterium]